MPATAQVSIISVFDTVHNIICFLKVFYGANQSIEENIQIKKATSEFEEFLNKLAENVSEELKKTDGCKFFIEISKDLSGHINNATERLKKVASTSNNPNLPDIIEKTEVILGFMEQITGKQLPVENNEVRLLKSKTLEILPWV